MPVLIRNRQRKQKVDTERTRDFTQRLLDRLRCGAKEVSLVIVNDRQITEINRDYLGKNRPTNVISFAMGEGEFGDLDSGLLGDVVVSVDTACRDALASGTDPADELDFLIIHGVLHLLGYEHEKAEEARAMRKKEAEMFSALKGYKLRR